MFRAVCLHKLPKRAKIPKSDPGFFANIEIGFQEAVGLEVFDHGEPAANAFIDFGSGVTHGRTPVWRLWQVNPQFEVAICE